MLRSWHGLRDKRLEEEPHVYGNHLKTVGMSVIKLHVHTVEPIPQRGEPRTVIKSTSVFACFEPVGGPCSCSKKLNSCAKNRSTPLDRLSEAFPCEVHAHWCLREQESFLTPHIVPAGRAVDFSPSFSLSGRVKFIRLMLCVSFYEWRCIYPGEQMILAPFLEKSGPDRAPGRFADYLFVPKHPKAYVLLTTVLGPLRSRREAPTTA